MAIIVGDGTNLNILGEIDEKFKPQDVNPNDLEIPVGGIPDGNLCNPIDNTLEQSGLTAAAVNVLIADYFNSNFNTYLGSSNLNTIGTRLHSSLQSLQGGATNQYYHLTQAQHTSATNIATSEADGLLSKEDWVKIQSLTGTITTTVFSVNAKIGTVLLTTNDIPDYTDKRYITDSQRDTLEDIVTTLSLKADLVDGKVPVSQLPSYVDEVQEYANFAAFPVTGTADVIYVALDTNFTYRWGGTVYVLLNATLALGETSGTAYRGDRGKTAYDHSQLTSGNPHNVSKVDLSLGNVDNTSDLDKPISTATQAALDLKYDGLPSQTGANGKYLRSNGTSEYWDYVTIPTATTLIKGMVQIGSNISVDGSGVISVAAPYVHPASHPWSILTSTPTTLSGYGITDAASSTHTHSNATTSVAGFMSAIDKTKLDGLSAYNLPTATDVILGGVKVGNGLSIDINGVLSTDFVDNLDGVNGITRDGDNFKLGGILTGNTVIGDYSNPAPTLSFISDNFLFDGTHTQINIGDLGFVVHFATNDSIKYDADYSAAYVDLSIPHKKWIEDYVETSLGGLKKQKYTNQNSEVIFPLPAYAKITSIDLRKISGTPLVTIGSATGEDDFWMGNNSGNSITSIQGIDVTLSFETSTNIYIGISGGVVNITITYEEDNI